MKDLPGCSDSGKGNAWMLVLDSLLASSSLSNDNSSGVLEREWPKTLGRSRASSKASQKEKYVAGTIEEKGGPRLFLEYPSFYSE